MTMQELQDDVFVMSVHAWLDCKMRPISKPFASCWPVSGGSWAPRNMRHGLMFGAACNFMFDASERRYFARFNICSWKLMARNAFSWLAVGFISFVTPCSLTETPAHFLSLSGLVSPLALIFLPTHICCNQLCVKVFNKSDYQWKPHL
jgi:hypothetical protein